MMHTYLHNDYQQERVKALCVQLLSLHLDSHDLRSYMEDKYGLSNLCWYQALTVLTVTFGGNRASYFKMHDGIPTALEINLSVANQLGQDGGIFEEYAAYRDDPVIGSHWVQNSDEYIVLLLAHELAHFCFSQSNLSHQQPAPEPHGTGFQTCYRDIRLFVNNWLARNQAIGANEKKSQFESKVLRKLHKLKAMAEHANSNHNEADIAQQQLEAMLSKYDIDLCALEYGQKPIIVERVVPLIKYDRRFTLDGLTYGIGQLCDVRVLRHKISLNKGKSRLSTRANLTLFGAIADVERAAYFVELLHRSVVDATEAFKLEKSHQQARNAKLRYGLRVDFHHGFIKRMNARLEQLNAQKHRDIERFDQHKTALMVLHNQEIEAAFSQRYPKIGVYRPKAKQSQHWFAQLAGKAAADKVNLNNPISKGGLKRLFKR